MVLFWLEMLQRLTTICSSQAGWVGKGKDPNATAASSHVSRPLTELKDPSSFGPPPKHINYHGAIAAPDHITPDTRGLGAPLPPPQINAMNHQQQVQQEQAQKPSPPPAPYRANTTGISVNHLPPPPVRRDISRGNSPAPHPPAGVKPNLPPRLPPRNPSQTSTSPSPPPPSYEASEGQLNRGAINRLGSAGVKVPAFGIGSSNPWKDESSQSSSTATRAPIQSPPVNELQSKFSKFSVGSAASPSSPQPPPSEGTTFAQKQAAFKTAQSFHKDPSSVSVSDARSAASTANNFRERHGEQVSTGVKTANGLNQKYGIANKLNGFAAGNGTGANSREATPAPPVSASPVNPALRKPPPPPPPKRMESNSSLNRQPPPPPLPLGTKPR